jgi:succinoglycan biosynthesis protein ExoO
MRYAFITDELPRPGAAGHLAMNFAIISWLQGLGHEVVVLLVGTRLTGPIEHYGLAPVAGPRVFGCLDRVVARTPWAAADICARAFLRMLPARLTAWLRRGRLGADAVLGGFATPGDIAWCARYVAQMRPAAVLVDTMFRAGILGRPQLREVNSVIIAHDVFYRRHQALTSAGYSVQPVRLGPTDEAAWLCGARHIAAIQPEEARLLAAMCPAQNVFVAAMPALPCPPAPGVTRIAGRLVFIGSAALPNLDGLLWFFDEVWPQLPPGLTLDLLGDCGTALRHLPPGVTRLGRRKHLAPVLHRAALAVAPMRVGSGLKIKLLDYARHGLATVATPPSVQGFAPDDGAAFIVAEGAAAFATAIMAKLADAPGPEAPLAYVTRNYGMTASFAQLRAALGA